MKYLKLFEENTINKKYKFFIDNVRHDLLVVDNDEFATYEYGENGKYKLVGSLSVEEYVNEKIMNKKCDFYCNSCWANHMGTIVETEIFDPDEDPAGGPWVKVKYVEIDKKVLAIDSEEWHDIEPYNQITVYGEQSELSKEHDKIRNKIVEFRDTTKKFNL